MSDAPPSAGDGGQPPADDPAGGSDDPAAAVAAAAVAAGHGGDVIVGAPVAPLALVSLAERRVASIQRIQLLLNDNLLFLLEIETSLSDRKLAHRSAVDERSDLEYQQAAVCKNIERLENNLTLLRSSNRLPVVRDDVVNGQVGWVG